MAEMHVQATEFTFSLLPEDDVYRSLYTVTVAYRGRGLWAVLCRGSFCLSRSEEWDYESVPSERTDEWLNAHRFGLAYARRLARRHARLIEYGGLTAEQLLNRAVDRG